MSSPQHLLKRREREKRKARDGRQYRAFARPRLKGTPVAVEKVAGKEHDLNLGNSILVFLARIKVKRRPA